MSILSSIGAGKLQFIKKYFHEKYTKMEVNIIEHNGEYVAFLKPLYKFGYIQIDLKEIPCNVDFEDMPQLRLVNANFETMKKIPKSFRSKCTDYRIVNTVYQPDDWLFFKEYFLKVFSSEIYVLDIFENDEKNDLDVISRKCNEHENKLYIKYKENNEYKLFDIDEWNKYHT